MKRLLLIAVLLLFTSALVAQVPPNRARTNLDVIERQLHWDRHQNLWYFVILPEKTAERLFYDSRTKDSYNELSTLNDVAYCFYNIIEPGSARHPKYSEGKSLYSTKIEFRAYFKKRIYALIEKKSPSYKELHRHLTTLSIAEQIWYFNYINRHRFGHIKRGHIKKNQDPNKVYPGERLYLPPSLAAKLIGPFEHLYRKRYSMEARKQRDYLRRIKNLLRKLKYAEDEYGRVAKRARILERKLSKSLSELSRLRSHVLTYRLEPQIGLNYFAKNGVWNQTIKLIGQVERLHIGIGFSPSTMISKQTTVEKEETPYPNGLKTAVQQSTIISTTVMPALYEFELGVRLKGNLVIVGVISTSQTFDDENYYSETSEVTSETWVENSDGEIYNYQRTPFCSYEKKKLLGTGLGLKYGNDWFGATISATYFGMPSNKFKELGWRYGASIGFNLYKPFQVVAKLMTK